MLPRSAMRPRPQEPHHGSRAMTATWFFSALLRSGALKSLTLARIFPVSGMGYRWLSRARHKPSGINSVQKAWRSKYFLIRCESSRGFLAMQASVNNQIPRAFQTIRPSACGCAQSQRIGCVGEKLLRCAVKPSTRALSLWGWR